MLRRFAPQLLRGAVTVPGVHDVVSGFAILRLVALRNAMRSHGNGLLTTDGWAANAELYWRTGRYARRVESVPSIERHDLRQRSSRLRPAEEAMSLWRARSTLRAAPIAPPAEPTTARPGTPPGAGVLMIGPVAPAGGPAAGDAAVGAALRRRSTPSPSGRPSPTAPSSAC